jgi:hypothetical protein
VSGRKRGACRIGAEGSIPPCPAEAPREGGFTRSIDNQALTNQCSKLRQYFAGFAMYLLFTASSLSLSDTIEDETEFDLNLHTDWARWKEAVQNGAIDGRVAQQFCPLFLK